MKAIFHVLFLLDSTHMFQESNMRIRNLFGYRDSELVYISGVRAVFPQLYIQVIKLDVN